MRQRVYESMTDAELEALCGPQSGDYFASLSDEALTAIATDATGHEAERGYQAYRRWYRKGGK